MAIVFRKNPIPRTGALYVTNPRRKKIVRRPNGGMNRWVYGQVLGGGKTPSRLTKDQKDKIVEIRMGRAGSKAQQKKAQTAMKNYKSGSGAAGTFKKRQKSAKRSFAKSIKTGSINTGKTTKKTKASAKAKTIRLSAAEKNAAFKVIAKKSVTSKAKFVTAAKKNKTLKARTKTELGKIYTRLTKLNPVKRRNAMAIAKSNPRKKKASGRKIKYTTFSKRLAGCGLTPKQKSSLWKKYKSTGKLPALAQPKKRKAAKKKASKGKSSAFANAGVTLRRLGYKGKLSAKSLSTLAGRRKKIKALRAKGATMKAYEGVKRASTKKASSKRRKSSEWSRLVKKHGVKKAKALYKKPKASAKRKTKAVRKARAKTPANTYVLYMRERKKMRGGATSGLSHSLAKKDYKVDKPKIDKLIAKGKTKLQAVKQVLKGKHGLLKRDKRFKVGGRALRKTAGAGVRSTIGAYPTGVFTRLNPFASMGRGMDYMEGAADAIMELKPIAASDSLFAGLGDLVSQVPFVGRLAPFVAPAGKVATTVVTMGVAKHFVAPHVMKALPMLAQYQAVSGTLLGSITALSIAGLQRLGVMDSANASQVGLTAVALGMGMDMYEYATSKGVPNYVRAPMAGAHLGDGGQYYVAPMAGTHTHRRVVKTAPVGALEYSGIVAPLSGAAGTASAPGGYGALMYTGAGY